MSRTTSLPRLFTGMQAGSAPIASAGDGTRSGRVIRESSPKVGSARTWMARLPQSSGGSATTPARTEGSAARMRRYHIPGSHLDRTRCVYSLYPANSACNVRSSHRVRRSSNSEARPTGISAQNEPRDRAIPTNNRQAPT